MTKRSHLLSLTEWMELENAAQYLAVTWNEDVKAADLLRIALGRQLKLSARFPNTTVAVYVNPQVIPVKDGEDAWHQELELKTHLKDEVYDLPMTGLERSHVEHEYQQLVGGPEVRLQQTPSSWAGPFIDTVDGTRLWFEDDGARTSTLMPLGCVLVVKRAALEDLILRTSGALPERKLGKRERDTLLAIIGALCKEANLDITQPSKAAAVIEKASSLLGSKVATRTIEEHLKRIPEALANKRQ